MKTFFEWDNFKSCIKFKVIILFIWLFTVSDKYKRCQEGWAVPRIRAALQTMQISNANLAGRDYMYTRLFVVKIQVYSTQIFLFTRLTCIAMTNSLVV